MSHSGEPKLPSRSIQLSRFRCALDAEYGVFSIGFTAESSPLREPPPPPPLVGGVLGGERCVSRIRAATLRCCEGLQLGEPMRGGERPLLETCGGEERTTRCGERCGCGCGCGCTCTCTKSRCGDAAGARARARGGERCGAAAGDHVERFVTRST